MGNYKLSNGEYISKKEIDRRIIKAKARKREVFWDEYGYFYCERCKKNTCKHISVSHIYSTKSCQEGGASEMSYDVNNLELLGLNCHMEWENKFSNRERKKWCKMKARGETFDYFMLWVKKDRKNEK